MLMAVRINNKLLQLIYPIGSIYINTIETNPENLFGGKWELFGAGRTLVCVDTSQSEFDTVEKVGGSKNLQSHSHLLKLASNSGAGGLGAGYGTVYTSGDRYPVSFNNGVEGNGEMSGLGLSNTGDGNSGNLQPFITCYMWKRIG